MCYSFIFIHRIKSHLHLYILQIKSEGTLERKPFKQHHYLDL